MSHANEALIYAKRLDSLGDRLISASQKLPPVNLFDKNSIELLADQGKILLALDDYEAIREELSEVVALDVIADEHQALVQAFEGVIRGLRIMQNSVTVYVDGTPDDAGEIDSAAFIKGYQQYTQGLANSDQTVARIIEKLKAL